MLIPLLQTRTSTTLTSDSRAMHLFYYDAHANNHATPRGPNS